MSSTEPRTVRGLKDAEIADERIVEQWIKGFQAHPGAGEFEDFGLTPLQRRTARHLLERRSGSRNLVIAGSTSAGKTMAAEMLMAHHLRHAAGNHRGCVYAVPLRALVTEKFARFRAVFGEHEVYVSSGDYQDQDAQILQGRFRIAVVVYEKLYSWILSQNSRQKICNGMGLLIVDEVQMLDDVQRGPRLEVLLTILRRTQGQGSPLRVVGMGPSKEALDGITSWLDAESLTTEDDVRPVPLVEGFISRGGQVCMEPLDSRISAEDVEIPPVRGGSRFEMMRHLVTQLVGRRVGGAKRVLVYCASKDMAEREAQALAEVMGFRQELSTEEGDDLETLEQTQANNIMRLTIPSGVGFHHGDLTLDERSLVERLFRAESGRACLDVVFCTPTLAMGVNLPADYMLFLSSESYRPTAWDSRINMPTPMTPLEYRNFAGRAGRFRPNMPPRYHGVALFLSERSEEEVRTEILEPIIRGRITSIESKMHRWPFGLAPLVLAAANTVNMETNSAPGLGEVQSVFAQSYAARCSVGVPVEQDGVEKAVPIVEAIGPVLQKLAQDHVELFDLGGYSVAKVGEIIARSGIHLRTYEILSRIAKDVVGGVRDGAVYGVLDRPLELLEHLVGAPEIVRLYPTALTDIPRGQADVMRELRKFFRGQREAGQALGPMATRLVDVPGIPGKVTLERLMRVAAVWLWIQGAGARAISRSAMLPDLRYGAWSMLGDQLHWLVSLLPDIWFALEEPDRHELDERQTQEVRWAMGRLERQLRFGVPNHLVSLAQLRVPGMHRDNLGELWAAVKDPQSGQTGWRHPVELFSINRKTIPQKSLRRRLVKVQLAIQERAWSDDPRAPAQCHIDIATMAIVRDTDGQRVDPTWPALIEQFWSADTLARRTEAAARALSRKPLTLRVVRSTDGARSFVCVTPDRSVELVALAGEGDDLWSQIQHAASGTDLHGQQLSGLIVIAQDALEPVSPEAPDALGDRLRRYGRAIRVASVEAFGELLAAALVAPEAGGAAEKVCEWFCAATPGVLRDRGQVSMLLREAAGFADPRWVEGRAGVSPTTAAPSLSETRQISVQRLRLRIEDLPGSMEQMKVWRRQLADALDVLPRDPTDAASRARFALESLLKHQADMSGIDARGPDLVRKLIAKGVIAEQGEWHRLLQVSKPKFDRGSHVQDDAGPTGARERHTLAFREVEIALTALVALFEDFLDSPQVLPVLPVS